MPSFAILGATGNTGQALLQVLSQSPENHIHLYARSRAKLLKLSPHISSNPKVKIFESSLQDVSTLGQCMTGTRAVFLAVAVSDNVPGCTVAQDTAKAVVAALQALLKQDSHAKLPRLVVLSASAINDNLMQDVPGFALALLRKAESHLYADLIKAESYLRAQSDWLSTTFIKPGALSHDTQKGHALSLERVPTSFLSFMDLAAGMVEVASAEGDVWDMKDVAVVPTASDVGIEWWQPYYLVKGLMFHYFPWLYPYLK